MLQDVLFGVIQIQEIGMSSALGWVDATNVQHVLLVRGRIFVFALVNNIIFSPRIVLSSCRFDSNDNDNDKNQSPPMRSLVHFAPPNLGCQMRMAYCILFSVPGMFWLVISTCFQFLRCDESKSPQSKNRRLQPV